MKLLQTAFLLFIGLAALNQLDQLDKPPKDKAEASPTVFVAEESTVPDKDTLNFDFVAVVKAEPVSAPIANGRSRGRVFRGRFRNRSRRPLAAIGRCLGGGCRSR